MAKSSRSTPRRAPVPRTAVRKPVTAAKGTRRKARRAVPVVHIAGSRKPTITGAEALSRLKELLAEFPALFSIWGTPELDPAFREELMAAVARQNDAPYCSWAHRTWAEVAGSSQAELAKIEQLDPRGLDPRKWAAVAYVRALASTDFAGVPRELRRELEAHFTAREIRDIELVAKVMDLINRMSNGYDAMLARLQGKRSEQSHVVDELIFSGVFAAVAPLMVLLVSRLSERPFLDTLRSLIDHVPNFNAQKERGPRLTNLGT